jgi:hypothetical protein
MKRMFWLRVLLVATILALPAWAGAQVEEARYSVPQLDAFHEVVYPLWHTGYPEKDLDLLRRLAPEVDRLARPVFEAQLPGILRERRDRWDAGLSLFKRAVTDYKAAAVGSNGEALLAAAEALHTTYEGLVRVVRPLPPEVMDFHSRLYGVYHTDLPARDYGAIRRAAADRLAPAEAVRGATLSRRFESKKDGFETAAVELLESVKALAAVPSGRDSDLIPAVERMHSRYQALEELFD